MPSFHGLSRRVVRTQDDGGLERAGMGDIVRGLTGLIVLGNAWESVDVYDALAIALQHEGRSHVSYLADLRCEELISTGKRSLHPEAPTGKELLDWVGPRYLAISRQSLKTEYDRLRRLADLRNQRREEFMLARLRSGSHPDTDSHFWDGYRETARPLLSGWIMTRVWQSAPLAAGVLLLLWLIRKVRSRKA